VDQDFSRASGLTLSENGTIVVDRFSLATSRPKFYAGGDIISGASNVSNAMGFGKKAARKMDEALMGAKRFYRLFDGFEYSMEVSDSVSPSGRHHTAELPPALRIRNEDEVAIGLTSAEALEESCRCLRCDVRG
jgi:NADH-quinone oxidoreductase subunit F